MPVGNKSALCGLILLGFLACGIALSAIDLDKMESLALKRYGPHAADAVVDWRSLVDDIKPLTDEQRLTRVNDFFNSRVRWSKTSKTGAKRTTGRRHWRSWPRARGIARISVL